MINKTYLRSGIGLETKVIGIHRIRQNIHSQNYMDYVGSHI